MEKPHPSESELSPEISKYEGKQLLHELERTGEYVFHGSPIPGIDEIKPRQPYSVEGGIKRRHGQSSVVATPYADIAIFRSLVYKNVTGFGVNDENPFFEASQEALNLARDESGYVYVLPKTNFAPLRRDEHEMDWRASSDQKPLRVVKVSFRDLPDDIQIIESGKGSS